MASPLTYCAATAHRLLAICTLLIAPVGSTAVQADESSAFDAYVAALQQPENRITTLEDFLAQLPRELKSTYSFVYDSRSMQESSYAYPRAVVLSKDGRLVMGFNGHPSQRGYEQLETIQFRESTRKFEFRVITFPEGKPLPVVVSEKDPARCKTCHTPSLRPNWDTYPFWPGVYGSEDDYPTNSLVSFNDKAKEYLEFEKFRANAFAHGRYKQLPVPQDQAYDGDEEYTDVRPNLRIGEYLGYYNSRRTARELAEAPALRPWRYGILGSQFCPDSRPAPDWVPRELAGAFPAPADYERKLNEIRELQERNRQERIARHARLNGPGYISRGPVSFEGDDFSRERIAAFRYLLEPLGFSFEHWSMSSPENRYVFHSPSNYSEMEFVHSNYRGEIRDSIHIPRSTQENGSDQYCSILWERHRLTLGIAPVATPMPFPTPPAPGESCFDFSAYWGDRGPTRQSFIVKQEGCRTLRLTRGYYGSFGNTYTIEADGKERVEETPLGSIRWRATLGPAGFEGTWDYDEGGARWYYRARWSVEGDTLNVDSETRHSDGSVSKNRRKSLFYRKP